MKNHDIIIRDGRRSDAEIVQSIAYDIMRSYGIEPDPEGLDYEIGHFGESYPGVISQLVACSRQRVIGSLILRAQPNNRSKLTGFYVDPDFRQMGAGRMLLLEAITRARTNRLEGITLDTLDSMRSAVNLYTSLGWRRIDDPPPCSGAERRYYLDLRQDDGFQNALSGKAP